MTWQHLNHLRIVMEANRLSLANEKATQADIAIALDAAGMAYERECRLSGADIPDFLSEGIAIEVKIGGTAAQIWRQLTRYARHDRVTGLLLVSNVPMALPSSIEGKPAMLARLGVSWI